MTNSATSSGFGEMVASASLARTMASTSGVVSTWAMIACTQPRGRADGDVRPPVRPAQPRRDVRLACVRRAARRPRRGADELRDRGRRVEAGAALDPGPDRVVVGLRAGSADAQRALRGVR